jgi:hypothetical protein
MIETWSKSRITIRAYLDTSSIGFHPAMEFVIRAYSLASILIPDCSQIKGGESGVNGSAFSRNGCWGRT